MPASYAQQTFGIEPDSILVSYPPSNEYSYYDISFPNLTNDTLTMQWRLAEDSMVAGWEYFLCDLGECYSEMPQNEIMEPATGEDIPYLEITIHPNDLIGEGKIVFYVNDIAHPQVKQRVEFIFIVGSSSVEIDHKKSFQLHPNPASEHLTVTAGSEQIQYIKIYNLSGQKLMDMQYPGSEIDVSFLPAGQYIITAIINKTVYTSKLNIIH